MAITLSVVLAQVLGKWKSNCHASGTAKMALILLFNPLFYRLTYDVLKAWMTYYLFYTSNGISTNKFQDALQPILGHNAQNVSPKVIATLKEVWQSELKQWRQSRLEDKQYAYWWVDGVYLSASMEDEKTCMLVIIGATEDGKKELVAFNDGFRECTESWLE